jgi:ParB/RepB/Spo0J family partition protein
MATTKRRASSPPKSRTKPSPHIKDRRREVTANQQESSALPSGASGALVPIDRIDPSPFQARKSLDDETLKELADSIRELGGLINPLTVRAKGEGRYEIIAGERRWRAVKLAELTQVPVVVVKATDRQARIMGLIENLQRERLNAMDRAMALVALKDVLKAKSWTPVAKRIGLSHARISQLVALTQTPEPVQKLVSEGKLTEGKVREIRSAAENDDALIAAATAAATGNDPLVGDRQESQPVTPVTGCEASSSVPLTQKSSALANRVEAALCGVQSVVDQELQARLCEKDRNAARVALEAHISWGQARIENLAKMETTER